MRVRPWIVPLAAIVLALAGCTDPSPESASPTEAAASAPSPDDATADGAVATAPGADWNEADRRYVPAVLADLEAARSLHDALLTVADLPAATEDLVGSLDTLLGIEIADLTGLVESVGDLEAADPAPVEDVVGAITSAEGPGAAVDAYLPAVTDLYSAAIERSTGVLDAGASERVHAVAGDLADGLEPDLAELRGLRDEQ